MPWMPDYRGTSDAQVLTAAASAGRAWVTADKEFANVLTYPPERHAGVLLVRLAQEIDPDRRIERIVDTLVDLAGDDLRGTIVVVEPARIRMRRSR
jgi:hypothetical protein